MKSIAFIALVVIMIAVNGIWGPIGNTRAFGILFLLASVVLGFAKEVPFSLGNVEVARLRGWAKLFGIVPALIVGVLLTLYAPEVTCMSHKHQHLCAGAAKP